MHVLHINMHCEGGKERCLHARSQCWDFTITLVLAGFSAVLAFDAGRSGTLRAFCALPVLGFETAAGVAAMAALASGPGFWGSKVPFWG